RSVPLVLDNINKKILPAPKRTDLKPVYSFNGEGMWIQKQQNLGKRVGNSSRIRLWTKLTNRMKKEQL
ncbi:MAG: sulfate adenylyltransferase, partial [Gammaproteobacteria bacterium]